jgi:hypothetical protein
LLAGCNADPFGFGQHWMAGSWSVVSGPTGWATPPPAVLALLVDGSAALRRNDAVIAEARFWVVDRSGPVTLRFDRRFGMPGSCYGDTEFRVERITADSMRLYDEDAECEDVSTTWYLGRR